MTHFGHCLKGFLKGFPTYLRPWESCKYSWSYWPNEVCDSSIRTLVNILAQVFDSFQSSTDFYIDVTIKEKKKLRTVRNYILISKPFIISRIVLQYQMSI